MSAPITYSIGRGPYDNRPTNYEAADLRGFCAHLLQHRARTKKNAFYLTPAFGNDRRRCAANAMPARFLRLDLDHIDAQVHIEWRLYAARWQGFGWSTASSTPEAPRERVVVVLDRDCAPVEVARITRLLMDDIHAEFGADVRVDPCSLTAAQPAFLPLADAEVFYVLGDPLDADLWLSQAPPPPPPPPPACELDAEAADGRMRAILRTLQSLLTVPLANGTGYALRCPWRYSHSTEDAPGSTATALMFPGGQNGWRGGFACLHSHCRHRTLRDVEALVRLLQRGQPSREGAV